MTKQAKFQGIKSWAKDDRPREKLMTKGRSSLSNAELLAILIGTGTNNESAVDLAKRILDSVDNDLKSLAKKTIEEFTQFKGIGKVKAINIITALEIGQRRRYSDAQKVSTVSNSQSAYELLQASLAELAHEEFWALFLSNSNRVLAMQQISIGGLTGTVADVRLIFKKALLLGATSIIVSHNHPSGNINPSAADKLLTKKLVEAGLIMNIKLIDHLIITDSQYFSFADEGLI